MYDYGQSKMNFDKRVYFLFKQQFYKNLLKNMQLGKIFAMYTLWCPKVFASVLKK